MRMGRVRTMSPQSISNGSTPASCLTQDRADSVPFRSILFDRSEMSVGVDDRRAPEIFTDLNLDQIVDSITANRDEYNLKPFFYAPLSDVETINYRYDILRDLEDQAVAGYVGSFAEEMRKMRADLAQADKLYYKQQKQVGFLTPWTSIAARSCS